MTVHHTNHCATNAHNVITSSDTKLDIPIITLSFAYVQTLKMLFTLQTVQEHNNEDQWSELYDYAISSGSLVI